MNQDETAKKITAYLDIGTTRIKAGTAYKLQLARQAALSGAAAQPQHASELALAHGQKGGSSDGRRPLYGDMRLWIGVLLIAVGFVAFQSWQIAQQTRDIEETDAALLTSDLPIEAYVDRGFQNWLKQAQP